MKVILVKDVDRLGKAGDIVAVQEGYARNYLIPKALAKPSTTGNIKMLDAIKKKRTQEEENIMKEARVIAEKIGNLSITIPANAGEEEKLFGSISNDMISEALAAENILIDKKDISIDEPIKKLGVYNVQVKVHPDVKATLKVWVVKS